MLSATIGVTTTSSAARDSRKRLKRAAVAGLLLMALLTSCGLQVPEATAVATQTPESTQIAGVVVPPEGADPSLAGVTITEGNLPVWGPPSLESSMYEAEGGLLDPSVAELANIALRDAKALGLPIAKTTIVDHGTDNEYRAAVVSKAANGNSLWGTLSGSDGVIGLTEQPTPMEWRDGAYHLIDLPYIEIPNSKDAVIMGGQGSDGTLFTAFDNRITLPDGSQIYATFFDMQSLREIDEKLLPGEWKFTPAVGAGKYGVIEGMAYTLDDQGILVSLGVEAASIQDGGDGWVAMLNEAGKATLVIDENGEQHKLVNGFEVRDIEGETEIWEWANDVFSQVELPEIPLELVFEVSLHLSEEDQIPVVRFNGLNIDYLEFKNGEWQFRPFSFNYDQDISDNISKICQPMNRYRNFQTGSFYITEPEYFCLGGLSIDRDTTGDSKVMALIHYGGKWLRAKIDIMLYSADVSKASNEFITAKTTDVSVLTRILGVISNGLPNRAYVIESGLAVPKKGLSEDESCLGFTETFTGLVERCQQILQDGEMPSYFNGDVLRSLNKTPFEKSWVSEDWLNDERIPLLPDWMVIFLQFNR